MLKCLVVGFTNNPGGIENVIMNYIKNFNKDKISVDFLCNTEKIAFEQEILLLGHGIVKIHNRRKNYILYKKDLKNLFKNTKYDIVWVNFCNITNLDCLKYAKKYGVKKRIIHSHNSMNMGSKIELFFHYINKRFLYLYATDFWSCGELAGKWFYNKKIINSDKYKIINNAIDIDKYKFDKKIRDEYRKQLNLDDKIVMGNVGRLHFQKNQDFLIDIFYEFQKKKSNSILLLVGDGDDKLKLKEKVNNLKIDNKVKFLGVRNDVHKIMSAMDVFVLPSLFEGLPLVLVEAQASGLPIFVSDSVTKEVKFSNNMYYFSLDNDAKKWANAIINSNLNRTDNLTLLDRKGYNIEKENKKIEKYLER